MFHLNALQISNVWTIEPRRNVAFSYVAVPKISHQRRVERSGARWNRTSFARLPRKRTSEMNTTQANHAPDPSYALGRGDSLRDELQISANWLHIANATRDYDQAKHAYELARRSYEIAIRDQRSSTQASGDLADIARDLGARLAAFELDLDSYTCWSERPFH
jgi:hypothetical protein